MMAANVVPPEQMSARDHTDCAGAASRAARCLWPIDRGAERLGGVGCGEHGDIKWFVVSTECWFFARTETIDRARHRKLRGTEAVDEIPATHGAAFFEGLAYFVKTAPALVVNPLDEDVYATPAVADGRLYVRTTQALWAFGSR